MSTPVTIGTSGHYLSAGQYSGESDIIIKDGVTGISEGCFKRQGTLRSVIMPDSITAINNDAFRDC